MVTLKDKNKISGLQLFFLTFAFVYSGTLLCGGIYSSGRSLWLSVIIGCAAGLLLMLCYVRIAVISDRAELYTANGIFEYCFGRIAGRAAAFLYGIYFLVRAASGLREYCLFWRTVAMPQISWELLALLLLGVCVYAFSLGLTAIGRLSEILMLLLPPIIIVLLLTTDFSGNTDNFFPLLEGGAESVFGGAVHAALTPFGDCVLFVTVFGEVISKASAAATPAANAVARASGNSFDRIDMAHSHERVKTKAFLFGGLGGSAAFILTALRDQIMIGPELMSVLKYPSDFSVQLIAGLNIEPLLELNMSAAYAIRLILLIGGGSSLIFRAFTGVKKIREENNKPSIRDEIVKWGSVYAVAAVICLCGAVIPDAVMTTANIIVPLAILLILGIRSRLSSEA